MTTAGPLVALLGQLTLAEKAALCLGSDFWHTVPVPRLGIAAIMVADGPHGLRKQTAQAQSPGEGSVPATCFPTASALGSSWDAGLAERIGIALGLEARPPRSRCCSGRGSTSSAGRCAGAIGGPATSTTPSSCPRC